MEVKVFEAPNYDRGIHSDKVLKVFLAGTIEMGNSFDWQQYVIDKLSKLDLPVEKIIIYNPRRANFGADANVRGQILWEQYHLDKGVISLLAIIRNKKNIYE